MSQEEGPSHNIRKLLYSFAPELSRRELALKELAELEAKAALADRYKARWGLLLTIVQNKLCEKLRSCTCFQELEATINDLSNDRE